MSELPTDRPRWEGLREVVQMAWPIMLGAMSFVLMDFVDKIFVSRLGIDNLAAVGSAGIWAYTLGIFFVGIAGCVSTFSAQSLGRGQKENCARYAWQGIYISIAAGSLVVLIWPFSRLLFERMGHTSEVVELELTYFRIRILGFAFVAWQAGLAAFFQSVKRPIIPMYAALVGNILNIVLDYILIFGKFGFPAMGIAGAAIATVLSMIVQAALLQAIFMSDRVNREYGSRRAWRFDWVKARDLFAIGWPSGVSGFLDVASWSIFTSFIVGGFGTVQLAAHTAAISYMHLMFLPAMALSMAATPIVGQWIGRGELQVAKSRGYTATRLAMIIMVVVGVLLATFGSQLMRVFSEDPEVIGMGATLLILAAIFGGFDAITIVLAGALRGVGDTRWMMYALTIGSYGVSLPLAWLFSTPLGLQARGAWVGATIYIILLSGVFLWRFHSESWRDIKIFSEDRLDDEEAGPGALPEELEENEQTAL